MLIKYKFANSEVVEVDVDESIGEVIVKSRKKEASDNRTERNHCVSADDYGYFSMEFASACDTETEADRNEFNRHFYSVFNKLTETQKRRLFLNSFGMSVREIARQEGVDHKTVLESIEAAKKKFKKYF